MRETLDPTRNPILACAIAETRGRKIDGTPLFRRYATLLNRYGGDGGRLLLHIPISETDKTDGISIVVTGHRRDQGSPAVIDIKIYPPRITTTAPPELSVSEEGWTFYRTAEYCMTDTGQRPIAFSQQTLENYLNLADILDARAPVEMEEHRLGKEKKKSEVI